MDIFEMVDEGYRRQIEKSDLNMSALEAAVVNEMLTEKSMSEDPEVSMKVALVTDSLIERSKLRQVTDPIAFSKGAQPTEGGLFSNYIFGSTPDERQRQFAYIDLAGTFFHPYVYEILKSLMPKRFEKCASGNGGWIIDKDGQLKEVAFDDKDYDENATGIDWLIENFSRLKFTESNSLVRKDRISFITSLDEEELFITKWLVIPVFYRDLDKNTTTYKLPELDVEYNNVIRYSNSLRNSVFDFFNHQTKYTIQTQLVAIRKRGQKLLEKKHGFFHKAILGKSIDRGSRDVISTATLTGFQRPEENPIDIFHSGIPLAKCMILGYDFIMRYCLQFFNDNFRDMKKYPIYKASGDTYQLIGEIPIKNQLEIFTSKYIEKKINRFKNSHETRFELIEIETVDGHKIPFHFTGQFSPLSKYSKGASSILTRPMTWTDLFYMAAYNTLSDKSVYITRYPITCHNSIFPTKCLPLSTVRTCRAVIEGVEYKNYPIIELGNKSQNISNLFIDTVTFSNLFLDAIGGDFDGDTTGQKLCFSLEANKEAEEVAESIKSFVSPNGDFIRKLGNEAYLTFFNMTRPKPVGRPLNAQEKAELLAIKSEELTINMIAKLFGNTTSMVKGEKKSVFNKTGPKFNPQSSFVLNAGEYTNAEQVNTTVGRFLFNKLLIENNLEHIVPNGYINSVMNKKGFGKLTKMIATALLNGKISVKPHITKFLTANEFWGLGLVSIFATSYSIETVMPNAKLEALKKKKLAEATDNSLQTLVRIEDELVEEANKIFEGTAGKLLFDSGARGSWENDFKSMQISVGPSSNPATGGYDFMESSYMGGIAKKDLVAAANNIVAAEYPKAIGTAEGGYLTKQFYAVYQNVMLDEPGSNCGTTKGLKVILTKDNLYDYLDQYIQDGPKLVLITEELDSKYMNKLVILRSPMYCLSEKLCSKCAGERFYKVDIRNIGLTFAGIGGKMMNASLKLRHSLKINMSTVDPDSLLL